MSHTRKNKKKGQAILEYLLMTIMLAVTIAVVVRNTNRTIYGLWTGLTRQVSAPCSTCEVPPAPDF